MELEDLLANAHRQIRLLEENEQRRKQQLENLILINNRLTLDNAALKKDIERFRGQREDVLNDMEELKQFHRELCGRHEALQHENQLLHETTAA